MVTLPPGPHPRGARPYIFIGPYHGEHVPGAMVKGTRIAAPVDAAWIFAEQGFALAKRPPIFPGYECGLLPDTLFTFQNEGANFLMARDYALLADEMGLGKTVQSLVAAEVRLRHGIGSGPAVLILCPAIAKRHWAREVKRWTGHEAQILDGVRPDAVPISRYVIANYDILYGQRRRTAAGKLEAREGLDGWEKTLAGLRFPIVICDEAHNLRGEKSRRTNAVKAVAEHSTCVWLLTGTPMPNHVRDIWALWDLASGGLAGWFWPWAKSYAGAVKGQYGWAADGASRQEELGKRLSFWCLGRTKASVGLQLPAKRRETVQVDVEVEVDRTSKREMYAGMYGNLTAQKSQVESALRATARAKRPAVVEMVKEAVDAKQKVVVFTYLREQCEAIARDVVWNNGSVFVANGDQTPDQRDASAQAFRECGSPAVFVATIDSVGVAISLVGSDLVIFADLSYDPSKLLQAEGRAHRIGSQRPVLIRYVVAAGTLDESVAEIVVDKLDVIAATIGGMGDGGELAGGLRRGELVTADVIVDRLFSRLTGG